MIFVNQYRFLQIITEIQFCDCIFYHFNINCSSFAIDVNASQKPKMGMQCTEFPQIKCPHDTCNYGYCENGCASSVCTKMPCDKDDNKDENQLCSLKRSNCKDGLICVDDEDGCDNGIGRCLKSGQLKYQ